MSKCQSVEGITLRSEREKDVQGKFKNSMRGCLEHSYRSGDGSKYDSCVAEAFR